MYSFGSATMQTSYLPVLVLGKGYATYSTFKSIILLFETAAAHIIRFKVSCK